MRTPFGRIVIYGFLTYAVVFMLWTFMYSYGIVSIVVFGETARTLNYIAVVAAVFIAARRVGISLLSDALIYGIGWALMHIILDVIYVVPAAGIAALQTPSAWINYALVFLAPFGAALYIRARNAPTIASEV